MKKEVKKTARGRIETIRNPNGTIKQIRKFVKNPFKKDPVLKEKIDFMNGKERFITKYSYQKGKLKDKDEIDLLTNEKKTTIKNKQLKAKEEARIKKGPAQIDIKNISVGQIKNRGSRPTLKISSKGKKGIADVDRYLDGQFKKYKDGSPAQRTKVKSDIAKFFNDPNKIIEMFNRVESQNNKKVNSKLKLNSNVSNNLIDNNLVLNRLSNQQQTITPQIQKFLNTPKKSNFGGIRFDLRGEQKILRNNRGETITNFNGQNVVIKRDGTFRGLTLQEKAELERSNSITVNPANLITGFFTFADGLYELKNAIVKSDEKGKLITKGLANTVLNSPKILAEMGREAVKNPFGFTGELIAGGIVGGFAGKALSKGFKPFVKSAKDIQKLNSNALKVAEDRLKELKDKGVNSRSRSIEGEEFRTLNEEIKILKSSTDDISQALGLINKPTRNSVEVKKKTTQIQNKAKDIKKNVKKLEKVQTKKSKIQEIRSKQNQEKKAQKKVNKESSQLSIKVQKPKSIGKIDLPKNEKSLIELVNSVKKSPTQLKTLRNRIQKEQNKTFRITNDGVKFKSSTNTKKGQTKDLKKSNKKTPSPKSIEKDIEKRKANVIKNLEIIKGYNKGNSKDFINKILSSPKRNEVLIKNLKKSQDLLKDVNGQIKSIKSYFNELDIDSKKQLAPLLEKLVVKSKELKSEISKLQTQLKNGKKKIDENRYKDRLIVEVKGDIEPIKFAKLQFRDNKAIIKSNYGDIEIEYNFPKGQSLANNKRGALKLQSAIKIRYKPKLKGTNFKPYAKEATKRISQDKYSNNLYRTMNKARKNLFESKKTYNGLKSSQNKKSLKKELDTLQKIESKLNSKLNSRLIQLLSSSKIKTISQSQLRIFKSLDKELDKILKNINKSISVLKKSSKLSSKTSNDSSKKSGGLRGSTTPSKKTTSTNQKGSSSKTNKGGGKKPKRIPKPKLKDKDKFKFDKITQKGEIIYREGNKKVKIKTGLPYDFAVKVALETVDESLLGSVNVKKYGKTKKSRKGITLDNNLIKKFRDKKSNSPKVQDIVEKRKFRLDSKKEVDNIQAKKILAKKIKVAKQVVKELEKDKKKSKKTTSRRKSK